LSYGVSTLASSMFTSVFVIKVSESLLLLSFIVTVGAGVAGALFPALKMTLSSPVEDLKEVAPFS
jgi:ABC-type antimicrobial peptide transport system permease subunit